MNVAYLMNTYPLTSTTFIRREIEALERQGMTVSRFALRRWDDQLVDPLDIAEIDRTHYILSGNKARLLKALGREVISNPGGILKALGPWLSLLRSARGGIVRHVAYLLEAIYFRQVAAKENIDHVHVHFLTNSTAVAMLSRIMGGPSYSATVHGPDELTDAPLLDFPAKIQHASFIAAITNFCRSQLIRFSTIRAGDKIKIVHCGLNLDDFDATPPPNNRTFVCVGRLCPQKGQAQLPSVVAKLRAEYPDVKVILIGDGPSRGEIESEIARLSVGENIEITGWMENAKVRAAIGEARAFLLPTFAEGLPVVIMEALALGRPVISTYIAGIPELVDEECGWILPAGDESALINAMRGALEASPETLAAMGGEGRSRIEAAHDVNIEAAKLAEYFAESTNAE
ncbi:glycosyltransferase family 4 protein [Hyphococcus lacteus]|uniref:Glycosyltransferase family 4 protein n=1 Tax=Hyphococcus lacteus TaxID=3143536 RepID=A0ABV3Z6X9_9PROT